MADASPLATAVEAFFRNDDWPANEVDEGAWISTVEGNIGKYQMSFEVRDGEVFVVRGHVPLAASEANISSALEYAARATYGLPLGVLEVDADSGRAAVRTGFDGEGLERAALDRLIFSTVYANVHLCDRYFAGFISVGLGTVKPFDALPADEQAQPDDT